MSRNSQITLIGINHKSSSLKIREQLVFQKDEKKLALKKLNCHPKIEEVAILSTCNRTEIYLVGQQDIDLFPIVKSFLKKMKNFKNFEDLYHLKEEEASHHLFRVVSGLDSLIVGETQILRQVKETFLEASALKTVGSILGKLFNLALVTGKKVHSNTTLSQGAVSVAYAAVELAKKFFENLQEHSVLLIGAGETGELTARNLKQKGVKKIYIANRTAKKAEKLAKELGGESISFQNLEAVLPKVTIIIGAASVPRFILNKQDLVQYFSSTFSEKLLLIDLGVPRNFDPSIKKSNQIFLHHMDNLEHIMKKNLKEREDQIPKAEAIIEKEWNHFLGWKKNLQITPTIVAFKNKLEDLRKKELAKFQSQLNPEEWKKMEKITQGLLGKILHSPLTRLKKYGNETGGGLLRAEVLSELFDLEQTYGS